jgi:uncharacterized membrane protein YccC
MASRKLSGDVIGFSGMKAAMRQFIAKDALGLHYAVQIFAGSTIVWLLLRSLGDANPLWAVVSLIVVAEPRLGTAWLAFLSRTLNTVIGCTMGLCFLLLAGPEGWVLPLALTATVLVCTYAIEVPISWRIAPITAALVIAPGIVAHSTSSALEIALYRSGEVVLGSAIALLMSWIMSKIWVVNQE